MSGTINSRVSGLVCTHLIYSCLLCSFEDRSTTGTSLFRGIFQADTHSEAQCWWTLLERDGAEAAVRWWAFCLAEVKFTLDWHHLNALKTKLWASCWGRKTCSCLCTKQSDRDRNTKKEEYASYCYGLKGEKWKTFLPVCVSFPVVSPNYLINQKTDINKTFRN